MLGPGWGGLLGVVQIFFAIVIGLYFWNLLRTQQGNKTAVDRESRKEIEKLRQLREISLTVPLSEKTRPSSFEEIVGQEEGLKALRAALCSPNPQHVIIYGSPGVGKTAAARLVLEEAKANPNSPFKETAKFVEVDATTARFDERGIADPLLGSVHDPINQGAGPLGMAGIPQPKPGAVTKAHGGILFIDEIGELHPIQMNKLLKVLEDRKVFWKAPTTILRIPMCPVTSTIFPKWSAGRLPPGGSHHPPAPRDPSCHSFPLCGGLFRCLRSRKLVSLPATHSQDGFSDRGCRCRSGRKICYQRQEAVNIIQIAGAYLTEGREQITVADIEWVVNSYSIPLPEKKIPSAPGGLCQTTCAIPQYGDPPGD